jgi:predicted O-methyltransferase YrrM
MPDNHPQASSRSFSRYVYWLALTAMRLLQQKLYLKLSAQEQDALLKPISRHLQHILQLRESNPQAYYDTFRWLEARGVHFTPNHFYYPIPDAGELEARPELFLQPSEMPGIDLADARQLRYAQEVFPQFASEYNALPTSKSSNLPEHAFYLNNGMFDGLDALVLYCMVRHFKPERILEVGSGWSSRLSAQAAQVNGNTKLTCIEPYPDKLLLAGFPGLDGLIVKKVEEVGLAPFEALNENDILFIDTAHVVKYGGDVNFLFLEVLPRLKKGVVVHVHDIFLPYEYAQWWVTDRLLFWNEQYLLQALLAFNDRFQILQAVNYMRMQHMHALQETFPHCPNFNAGQSFWMQKVK